jgi:uncharacterized protein (TIGR02001 family)
MCPTRLLLAGCEEGSIASWGPGFLPARRVLFVFRACMMVCGLLLQVMIPYCDAAEISLTSAVVSDYDYRGVSQTDNDPALQVGVDYTNRAMHIQAWTSNVNFDRAHRYFGPGHTEIALTVDSRGQIGSALTYGGGINFYDYPGETPDQSFPELFLCLAHLGVEVTVHYTPNYDNDRRGTAYYVEMNGAFPLRGPGLRFLAHLGESTGEYWTRVNGRGYADYSVGFSKSFAQFDVSLRFVGTSDYFSVSTGGALSGNRRWVLSVSTTIS